MFRLKASARLLLPALLLMLVSVGNAQNQQKAAEGKEWFRDYCASCHGEDAKGHGPAAPALKDPPADLTTLAKRNNGKFPPDYVKKVLAHGVAAPAHGTSAMPIWGPTFAGVNQDKLIQYLESVQAK